jgi:DNA-binding Lrp family transcriptional regulator
MSSTEFDKGLIKLLLSNGRASLRTLAEELNVSVTTVSNSLDGLEDTGIIDGFVPKINYNTLGYDLTAVVQIDTRGNKISGVLVDIKSCNQFINLYTLNDGSIVAIGLFRDISEMNTYLKSIRANDQVRGISTSVVIDKIVENRDIIDPETGVVETVSANESEEALLTEIEQEFELPDEIEDTE